METRGRPKKERGEHDLDENPQDLEEAQETDQEKRVIDCGGYDDDDDE